MDTEHTNDYGMHLIVDGYDANPQALRDIARAYRFLDELPARIGMQKIGPPQLSNFDDPMMAGITGIIQIVTSHISIHTYANKGCVFLDVFSCQTFSCEDVIAHACEVFGIQTVDTHIIRRGKQFPEHNTHS